MSAKPVSKTSLSVVALRKIVPQAEQDRIFGACDDPCCTRGIYTSPHNGDTGDCPKCRAALLSWASSVVVLDPVVGNNDTWGEPQLEPTTGGMQHLDHLHAVLVADEAALRKAEAQYQGSWKRRGGVGAFMMLARKWDRIEARLSTTTSVETGRIDNSDCPVHRYLEPDARCSCAHEAQLVGQYDIFGHVQADKRAEGLIDDIRDLRRYLALVEAELAARGVVREEVRKD